MTDFQSDFMQALGTRKGEDVADVVGMPDDQDYETLSNIITKFEKRNPGLIRATLAAGRRDYETGVHKRKQTFTGKTTVNKDSNMTYVFELPAKLYEAIETVFPSMFRSKKHLAWFKKNFYQLTIGNDK